MFLTQICFPQSKHVFVGRTTPPSRRWSTTSLEPTAYAVSIRIVVDSLNMLMSLHTSDHRLWPISIRYASRMSFAIDSTSCSECGAIIDEPASTPIAERKPCPSCGSTVRTFSANVHETLTLREKLGLKHKRPGHKKAIYESVSGEDLHRATGQWSQLTREIDRENDRYKEVIVNPQTGEVIRQVDEPLSDHTGRGTAKPKLNKGGADA